MLNISENEWEFFFMAHSFASEKWLSDFLAEVFSKHPDWRNEKYNIQLADEIRHTEMCRNVLRREGREAEEDLSVSIQNALYSNIGRIDFNRTSTIADLECVLFLIERRAKFLYKMYLRYGTIPSFKKVIANILQDEENHLVFNPALFQSEFGQQMLEADQYIFGSYLPNRYGQGRVGVFKNLQYWRDLFRGGLI